MSSAQSALYKKSKDRPKERHSPQLGEEARAQAHVADSR
jgi:hypothetical protein